MPDAAHAASAATKEFLHGPLVAYSKFGFFVIDGRSGKPLCAQQISATMASGRKLELMLNDRSACSYYTWDGEPGTVTIVVKHPGYSPATRSVLLEYDDGCWLRGKPTDFTIDLTPAGAGGP